MLCSFILFSFLYFCKKCNISLPALLWFIRATSKWAVKQCFILDQSIHGGKDISVITTRLPTIPCSNCVGPVLALGSSERRPDARHKRPLKPQLPPHARFASPTPTHTQATITCGRVNQSFSKPFEREGVGGGLIPQLLASGSRQYLVSHCAKLWSGSVGPACPASPALSMHGSPQLSFYFRSMEAFLGPAGASETMDMLPYLNTDPQTIWRTPGSQRELRCGCLLPSTAVRKG